MTMTSETEMSDKLSAKMSQSLSEVKVTHCLKWVWWVWNKFEVKVGNCLKRVWDSGWEEWMAKVSRYLKSKLPIVWNKSERGVMWVIGWRWDWTAGLPQHQTLPLKLLLKRTRNVCEYDADNKDNNGDEKEGGLLNTKRDRTGALPKCAVVYTSEVKPGGINIWSQK